MSVDSMKVLQRCKVPPSYETLCSFVMFLSRSFCFVLLPYVSLSVFFLVLSLFYVCLLLSSFLTFLSVLPLLSGFSFVCLCVFILPDHWFSVSLLLCHFSFPICFILPLLISPLLFFFFTSSLFLYLVSFVGTLSVFILFEGSNSGGKKRIWKLPESQAFPFSVLNFSLIRIMVKSKNSDHWRDTQSLMCLYTLCWR